MIINAPTDRKLYGVNLTPKRSNFTTMRTWIEAFTYMFQEWDWDNWIKPSLDNIASIGCNVVSVMGSLSGAYGGIYTQATYNARWQQLADYCAEKGMMLYYRGGMWPQVSASNSQNVCAILRGRSLAFLARIRI